MARILFYTLVSLFFSCSGSNDELFIPDGILPKEKMIRVMTDIHLLEASLNLNLQEGGAGSDKNPARYASVFKKYGISGKIYYESFEFYTRHPETLTEMYEEVWEKLNRQLSEEANSK